MTDIRNEKWLWIKGGLFLVISVLSVTLLLLELSNAKQILLLLVSVWACCRSYYFAFYVIEKYIRWYNANELIEKCSMGKEHRQLSIRYLIAATVVVAASCLAIKNSNGGFRVLTEYEFLVSALTVLVGSVPVVWLLILIVGCILSPLTWERRWKSLVLIAVGMLIFPFVVHRMAQFSFSSGSPAWRSIKWEEMLQLYCFIGGFMTSTTIVLSHARTHGFRVEYRAQHDIALNEDR